MNDPKDMDRQLLQALHLIGLTSLRGLKQREQVDLLDRAGYGQKEIAALLNSTPNAISVRLAEVRKERKKRLKPTAENG
jgi:DNA-directed RNA polymerase specialized sigma24 family protein